MNSYYTKIIKWADNRMPVIRLIIILFILLFQLQLFAQNNCPQNLKLAEKKFEAGLLREIPEILFDCLSKNQFSAEEQINSLKLLTLTYLYLDDSLNAELHFYNLMKSFPDFQVNPENDPAELYNLYKSYRTLPLYSYGFTMGLNFTHVSVLQMYGVDNIQNRTEIYTPLPGLTAGFKFDVPVSKKIYLSTGANYSIHRYKNVRDLSTTSYASENKISYNFSEVNFTENQSWIQVPFTISTFLGNKRFKHFIYGGASIGGLLFSKAEVSRKFSYPSISQTQIKGPLIEVSEIRNSFYMSGIIGAGVKIKSGLNFITTEIRYEAGFTNITNPLKRYSNSQLMNRYGYLDNDLRTSTLTISGSYMITRYKPKKLKVNL